MKSRLSGLLSGPRRVEFAKLLLLDVLGALSAAGLLGSTYVVTRDEDVLGLAAEKGAGGIREEDESGVDDAVLRGVDKLGRPGAVLVIPSDLPLLRPSDVRDILWLKSRVDVVISPSQSFNGTNALAYSPASGLELSYDNNSFWNHLRSAARSGLTVAVCCRKGLMFDVDSPEDFRALAGSRVKRRSTLFARGALR